MRADENALWSLGAHDVSVLLALAGEEPNEVVARGECYMREGIEDVVFCFLRFPSGLAAHLHLSWLDPHKERRFTVVGETRMATFDDMALEGKITVYDKGFDEQAGRGCTASTSPGGDIWSPRLPTRALRTEIEHFVDRSTAHPISAARRAARRPRPRRTSALARRDAAQRCLAHGRAQHVIDARTLKVRAYKALQAGAGRVGLQVVPKNYYSPIPDLDALPAGVFDRRSALRGIHFDLDEQVAWIERHLADAMREFDPAPEVVDNASYGRVGADLLHGIVRALKPRRIVELGSGHSTLFMAAAAERNRTEGAETELRMFAPYPTVARPGLPGLASLEAVRAQDVPLDVFTALESGDVLFVDTTHTVKLDSDVNRIVLDVLPALAPGVLVHVHDIFLPYEYPRRWLEESGFFWAEQYLLQAFLVDNPPRGARRHVRAVPRPGRRDCAPGADVAARRGGQRVLAQDDRRSSSAATCFATAARLNRSSATGSTAGGGASSSRVTARATAASSPGGAQPASWPRSPSSRSVSLAGPVSASTGVPSASAS